MTDDLYVRLNRACLPWRRSVPLSVGVADARRIAREWHQEEMAAVLAAGDLLARRIVELETQRREFRAALSTIAHVGNEQAREIAAEVLAESDTLVESEAP